MLSVELQLTRARLAGVPLVALRTQDPAASVDAIVAMHTSGHASQLFSLLGNHPIPIVEWDAVRGARGRNDAGVRVTQQLANGQDVATATRDLGRLLQTVATTSALPMNSILLIHNAHLLWRNANGANLPFVQAVWNLRDLLKTNSRMAILLTATTDPPTELAHDLILIEETLPTAATLGALVDTQWQQAGFKGALPADDRRTAVNYLTGLALFSAEQTTAMSLTENGLDLTMLRERKRAQVRLHRGMKVFDGSASFDNLKGVDHIRQNMQRLAEGPMRPGVVCWFDELEKQIAGFGGDNTGSTDYQVGRLLSFMQDRGVLGVLAMGHPGTGKSQAAKCLGNLFGCEVVEADMGRMKAKHLGESEAAMDNFLQVVDAMRGDQPALFYATVNSLGHIPSEMLRRFRFGRYFFDLPAEDERRAIWPVHLKTYGLTASKSNPIPADDGWTGSDIETCCMLAHALRCPLVEAAARVVPVSQSDPESIASRRAAANNRYLSASGIGTYRLPASEGVSIVPPARAVKLARDLTTLTKES